MSTLSNRRCGLHLEVAFFCAWMAGACSSEETQSPQEPRWTKIDSLPQALSNNAVTSVESTDDCELFSFMGITSPFDESSIHNKTFWLSSKNSSWSRLSDVPGPPRLATSAVTLGGVPYILGGYSLGAGGAEISHDSLFRFNRDDDSWTELAPLPVAIDDAVALSWNDKIIVVVSGWSDTANVRDVQFYDVAIDQWFLGTEFPGTPVFGHTGAISRDTLIITDGAASSRGFPIVHQTWLGKLDPAVPGNIEWTELEDHPGPARYRAASGRTRSGLMVTTGGTSTPYNFDGLSYDDQSPVLPLESTYTFDRESQRFEEISILKPLPTMDHRSLAECGELLTTVGGMVAGPDATTDVWSIEL